MAKKQRVFPERHAQSIPDSQKPFNEQLKNRTRVLNLYDADTNKSLGTMPIGKDPTVGNKLFIERGKKSVNHRITSVEQQSLTRFKVFVRILTV